MHTSPRTTGVRSLMKVETMPALFRLDLVPSSGSSDEGDEMDRFVLSSPKKSIKIPVTGTLSALKAVFLDVPLLVIFLSFAATSWVYYVHEEYVEPHFKTIQWTRERKAEEMTYYPRKCDAKDVTTKNGLDLYLDEDAKGEEAYAHQLKHGMTVVRQVITPETATALRNHIVELNPKLGKEYDVLKPDNRYSFGLSSDEPSVRAFLREMASHKQFSDAVEAIMGPDPAMVEMTAITSSYGALGQLYHDDITPESAANLYSRSFGGMFSIFIQLQNTTKEMGATGICPGTHFCTNEDIPGICEEEGYQLVDPNTGYCAVGDAAIMSMNTMHRGSAHVDPDGGDRVMVIITMSPRPREVAESRQVAMGSTLSMRWDMWGNTWRDLRGSETLMTFPWYLPKTLGLYKRGKHPWGYDFITLLQMRIANDPSYWKEDSLEEFIEDGGFRSIPEFLHPDEDEIDLEDERAWYYYIRATFHNIYAFHKKVVLVSTLLYLLFVLTAGAVVGRTKSHASKELARISLFGAAAYSFFGVFRQHVDMTLWAKDIRANRLYSNIAKNDRNFGVRTQGFTTHPNRNDVLIDYRLVGSDYLGIFKDYCRANPGNQRLYHMVKSTAALASLHHDSAASYIFDAIGFEHGRFLQQGNSGKWIVLPKDEAMTYIQKALANEIHGVLKALSETTDKMKADLHYGLYGGAAMSGKHAFPFLNSLEDKLYPRPSGTDAKESLVRPHKVETSVAADGTLLTSRHPVPPTELRSPAFSERDERIAPPRSRATTEPIRSKRDKATPTEEFPGDWFRTGSVVEGLVRDDSAWYAGTVLAVNALGNFAVKVDGEILVLFRDELRVFEPYQVGEKLEVYLGNDDDDEDLEIEKCEIVAALDDGTFDVVLTETGEHESGIEASQFRRIHMKRMTIKKKKPTYGKY